MKRSLALALLLAVSAFAAEIHDAASRGDVARVRALIDSNPALLNAREGDSGTPLNVAAYNGRTEVVAYLLEKGAAIEARNRYGNTPLILASMQGHRAVAEALLAAGAVVDARGHSGGAALMTAAGNNRSEIVRLLLDRQANPNAVNDNGSSALDYALAPERIAAARMLLDAGAAFNRASSDGTTPLFWAAGQGNAELVKLLLERGASAATVSESGYTPLTIALRRGRPEAVPALLGVIKDLDARDSQYGRTALHWAAIRGYSGVEKRLLAAGASSASKDKAGRTPAEYAARYSGEPEAGHDVFYLGHSGWAVKTARRLLIFDYAPPAAPADRPCLRNGRLTPADLQNRDVYVFVSHDHSDHFSRAVLDWKARLIFGFEPEGVDKSKVEVVAPNQQKTVGDVTVRTLRSIDAGVGFLVAVDGLTIFHAGDHANLNRTTKPAYEREIDALAAQARGVDIAFLPVTGCSSTWTRGPVLEGFLHAIQAFQPKMVFPMHGWDNELDYPVFAKAAKDRGLPVQVLAAENPGDSFRYGVR